MIPQKDIIAIKSILSKHLDHSSYKAYIFGSRATGNARKWSDIDIAIEGEKKVPGYIIEEIREDLENSNLPFVVDIVDFSLVSKRFKSVANQKVVPLT